MNRQSKLVRLASTALIAVLLAVSVTMTLMQALAMPVSWLTALIPALIAALACAVMAASTPGALLVLLGAGALAGLAIARDLAPWRAVRSLYEAFFSLEELGSAAFAGLEGVIAALIAAPLACLFFALTCARRRSEVGAAVLVAVTAIIAANALSRTANLLLALPALIACLAAYSHAADPHRETGFFRALVPAVLAVLVAFLLVPSGGLTWAPLERAADRVRSVFEDYFRFTQERTAFSINEQGYDHAGEINGVAVAMLGGPAVPGQDPVMRVETDTSVLLRGSIRRTYTGYSWTDDMEKARYLYYDFTRRGVRAETFDMDRLSGLSAASAFGEAQISVEMLDEGTSTLFVPGRLVEFSMPLETASYFNSVGEVFLSRDVAAGDSYSARWNNLRDPSRLPALLAEAETRDDERYQTMLDTYTGLPPVVDRRIYDLVDALTADLTTPYEKALAIQGWLQANCAYKLNVAYPPADRDFVSWFLVDSREGYCSYFASAMAVMCRIAGIPSRYIEGYYAVPDESGQAVLTGQDAHAWVELYFRGLGWLPFDPTAALRGDGGQGGINPNDPEADGANGPTPPPAGSGDEPEATPSPTPDAGDGAPEPTPTPEPDAGNAPQEPTPSPEPENAPEPPENPSDPPQPPEPPNDPKQDEDRDWLWFLLGGLLLLLLLALCLWARRRLRRADPARLTEEEPDANRAAMILYRANLTVLSQMGHVPLSGETPEAFADRLARNGLENPDFERFAHAVAVVRYARQAADGEVLDWGQSAYALFEKKLSRRERLRYGLRRVLHGLGDFDAIP